MNSPSPVFVTGATGLIGSAAARSLIARGHSVLGLARSKASAAKLREAGVEPVTGDLTRPATLRAGVERAAAVVHAAFVHDDWNDFAEAVEVEEAAVAALLDALAGTAKPFVYTSGTGIIGDTGPTPATEDAPLHTPPFLAWRPKLEQQVLAADHGIVLRPGLVYGRAGSGVLVGLIREALDRGAAFYIGDGANAWTSVHVDDLGQAYALAVEKAPPGTLLNLGVADVTMRAMADAIGRLIGAPEKTFSIPLERARELVPFADGIASDQRIDPRRARTLLGWTPSAAGLVEEIEHGSYRAYIDHTSPASEPAVTATSGDEGLRDARRPGEVQAPEGHHPATPGS
jgi:nucleoside-diphosphate-sugar epimerase